MLIRNLAGLFTGKGFVENEGRHPTIAQADFVKGPIDLYSENGVIVEIGANITAPSDCEVLNGAGSVALPGYVDSHTHAIFAGNRSSEYFHRWSGKTYVEIANAGGGIRSTQDKTIDASDDELVNMLVRRFDYMLSSGTVAVEVKSGYGRCAREEIRLLTLIREAANQVPDIKVIPTFLGLHALPAGREERDFVDEMIGALQAISDRGLAEFSDSFPEKGFFSLEESLRFAEASKSAGLKIRTHADELSAMGASLAFIRAGAASIDHLQHIDEVAISALSSTNTVATLLPATSFFLGLPYANARRLIDAGAKVSLGTDFNPGTAPRMNFELVAALAGSQMKLTAAEILCGITFNGAQALGIEGSHGNLSLGMNCQVKQMDVGGIGSVSPQDLLETWVLSGV